MFGGVAVVIAVLYVGSALFVEAYPLDGRRGPRALADCPPNAFFVLAKQPAFIDDVVAPVREALGVLLFVGVSASLVQALARRCAAAATTIGPLMVMSVVSTACLAVFSSCGASRRTPRP